MRKSLARRFAAAAIALSAGLTGVVLGSAPAQAAGSVSIASATVSPSTVILDGDAGCGNRATVTVKVYTPGLPADDLWGVDGYAVAPNGDNADYLYMKLVSRSGDYATYSDKISLCGFQSVGGYRVDLEATWWDDELSTARVVEKSIRFSVKRPTSLTYNATPEPVKKGKKLTHAGVFKLDPNGYGPKKGVKGAVLKFYFKANGAKTYTYKGRTTTTAGGKYSKKITATKSGVWKVVYAGTSTRQAQTKYDTVKVK